MLLNYNIAPSWEDAKLTQPRSYPWYKFKIVLCIWFTAYYMFYIFLRVYEQLCICRHPSLRIPVFTGGFVVQVNIVATGALSSAPLCIYQIAH